MGHFHLSPVQVGIPNDRPRYFCVAVKDTLESETNNQFIFASTVFEKNFINELSKHVSREAVELSTSTTDQKNGATNTSTPNMQTNIQTLQVEQPSNEITCNKGDLKIRELPQISTFLDPDLNINDSKSFNNQKYESLRIPKKILSSNTAWCFDIVTPLDCRSSCFTHSYGGFVRGTGSVLYTKNMEIDKVKVGTEHTDENTNELSKEKRKTKGIDIEGRFVLVPPEERVFDTNWAKDLDLEQNLRYFSGTEVGRLMGFPISQNPDQENRKESFSFPDSISLKQQWKLLGNSLNVRVASKVAELGLYLALAQRKAG